VNSAQYQLFRQCLRVVARQRGCANLFVSGALIVLLSCSCSSVSPPATWHPELTADFERMVSNRKLLRIRQLLYASHPKESAPTGQLILGSTTYNLEYSSNSPLPTFFRTGSDGLRIKILSEADYGVGDGWRVVAIRIPQDQSAFGVWLKDIANTTNKLIIRKFSDASVSQFEIKNLYDFVILNGAALYYIGGDSIKGPRELKAKELSAPSLSDSIYLERDPRYALTLSALEDGNSLLLEASSLTENELHLVSRDRPPVLLAKRKINQKTKFASGRKGLWWIGTDQANSNLTLQFFDPFIGKLKSFRLGRPIGEPEELDSLLSHLFLRTNNLGKIDYHLISKQNLTIRKVPPPNEGCWLVPLKEASELNFECHYYTTLNENWVLDDASLSWTQIAAEATSLKKSSTIKKFLSSDGETIPVTYIENREKEPRATLAIVYGTYGTSLRPDFDPLWRTILEMGFDLAFVHVRGGGFKGSNWHHAGRGASKHRSVEDLIAVSRKLSQETQLPLFLMGKSAGGTVAASALNKSPALYRGAILDRPFLDLASRIRDSSDPLMLREMDEWFSERSYSTALAEVNTICPTTGLKPQSYPPILIRAARHDEVIKLSDVLNYTTKLSEQGKSQVLLRISETGTHKGEVTLDKQVEEDSYLVSFLLAVLSSPRKKGSLDLKRNH